MRLRMDLFPKRRWVERNLEKAKKNSHEISTKILEFLEMSLVVKSESKTGQYYSLVFFVEYKILIIKINFVFHVFS